MNYHTEIEPGIYNMPADVYYPMRRMSKSMIENSRPGDSRPSMQRLLAAWEGKLKKEPTARMKFGNAFDSYLLTPQEFRDEYHVVEPYIVPDFGPQRKTDKCTSEQAKINKQNKAAWLAENPEPVVPEDKELVTAEDFERIKAMAASVRLHPAVKLIRQDKGNQAVLIWNHGRTPMKARLDRLVKVRGGYLIIDIKVIHTVTDIAIQRAIGDFGYHRQNAIYADAVKKITGNTPRFLFIFVEEKEPHEVRVIQLGHSANGRVENAWIKRGRYEYQRALTMWEAAIETGNFGQAYEDIHELEAPAWISHGLEDFGG